MSIEEKLDQIKELNEQKDKIDSQLSCLENLDNNLIETVTILNTPIKITDQEVSALIWQSLHDMLETKRAALIEQAKNLMK